MAHSNILFFCMLTVSLVGQDMYHKELISSLQTDYGVSDPSFTLYDSEATTIDAMFFYGNGQKSVEDTPDDGWTKKAIFEILALGNNQWDAGTGLANQDIVMAGDVLMLTFWAKKKSNKSLIYVFAEDIVTFDKQIYFEIEATADWTQYFIPFKSTENFSTGAMNFGFHLAGEIQTVELAGFTVLNYGDRYDLGAFPSTFSAAKYGGFEVDAPWRSAAADRIESLRKAELNISVVDAGGDPIENASVTIEMQDHEYGFGSAFVSCRFPGNDCANAKYLNKITDLDGKGHGFNVGVMENALKWDGWEEEWIGSPEETVSAIRWLADAGVEMRGHTLFWPGYEMMPDDIQQNQNNLDYVRSRIDERIKTMMENPVLSALIQEWDVLNEITQNRDLERMFQSDPQYITGREVYQEILSKIKEINPDQKNYINDYITLSGGGSSQAVVSRYKEYLDEIYNSDVPFDGIGFQCHIGTVPTSIIKIENTLNEFYKRYIVPFKITEFDLEPSIDEELQASYMADFLTMVFSHPAVDAFIMWGFWDGNHWKSNAPIFNLDWSLKPSGQAFIDKVFHEWWTSETLTSNAEGMVNARVFKGEYIISIAVGDSQVEQAVTISDTQNLEITIDATTSTEDVYGRTFQLVPNPIVDQQFSIIYPDGILKADLRLYNITGQLVYQRSNYTEGQMIEIDPSLSGLYILQMDTTNGQAIKKVVIK